ncbi:MULTISPECIES: hypothetical protein [Streptomyces]|uniref:hypothetical protein n=1 Tax=Streptomyces TaxID=1883 RepID=UPI0013B99309|nr:hypothetical protein [Streptomyces sp. SID8014]NEC10965.1 hypothetical protein [Streptomyces sp. SID8014]
MPKRPLVPAAALVLAVTGLLVPGAAHAAEARPAASSWSRSAVVVAPGEKVELGHGYAMTLTREERCVGSAGGRICKSVTDGNQPAGTVSLQSFGEEGRTLYSPLYVGPGRAARMTVTAAGRTLEARVVALAGRPGYATGYVWSAAEDPADRTVTVYDATGRVLARY